MPSPPRARALSDAIGPDRITVGSISSSARLQSIAALGVLAITAPMPLSTAPFDEIVDQRILQRMQRLRPSLAEGDQPVRIVAARVRDRNQHRHVRHGADRWPEGKETSVSGIPAHGADPMIVAFRVNRNP